MDRKKKKCRDCGKPSYIKGHGRCSYCYNVWYATEKKDKLLSRKSYKPKRTRISKGKKRTKPTKTRKQKLIAKLDKSFSLLIRLKFSDDEGVCSCYTCGKKLAWKRGAIPGLESAQACHYMSRRYMSTRWDELNVHPGCNECNVIKHGNLGVYEKRLREDYGEKTPDRLWTKANMFHKYSDSELASMLYHIEREYKELKKEKSL